MLPQLTPKFSNYLLLTLAPMHTLSCMLHPVDGLVLKLYYSRFLQVFCNTFSTYIAKSLILGLPLRDQLLPCQLEYMIL